MLAIGFAFLGIGLKNVLLALVVLAVPPIITNAYVGIEQVDPDLVDAARGMGMTGWQVLWRVELPLAIPLVMAGVRTAALFVVSTTTIAALAGYADSLGEIINNEASYHLSGVLGAAICIAVMAIADRARAGAGAARVDARGRCGTRSGANAMTDEFGAAGARDGV